MSAILSADDLNDFISPGVACIKPVETLPPLAPTESENASEVILDGQAARPAAGTSANISLTDCLACSGCVTSAEAVLVSLQSHAEVLTVLDSAPALRVVREEGGGEVAFSAVSGKARCEKGRKGEGGGGGAGGEERAGCRCGNADEGLLFVASVAPQVRANLAAACGPGVSEREVGHMLERLFIGPEGLRSGGKRGNGFAYVVDTNVAREACLVLGADEVLSPGRDGSTRTAPPQRPILTSSCPGWICYAEKTHPHVIPHLSRLKSPQALTGTLLKTVLSKKLAISPSRIWHLAVMPCFDKKLEASREELTDSAWDQGQDRDGSSPGRAIRDVDCVITSKEILMLAESRGINFFNLARCPLPPSPEWDSLFPDPTLSSFLFPAHAPSRQAPEAGTSGGNLYHLLQTVVSRSPGAEIRTSRGRNADVAEYSVVSASGRVLFRAARYYGFRNIQNLVRKLKPAAARPFRGAVVKPGGGARKMGLGGTKSSSLSLEYDYVEVMACPGGCTNGGGQIKVEDPVLVGRRQLPEKPGQAEQKEWLAAVDEAYFSADETGEPPQTADKWREDVVIKGGRERPQGSEADSAAYIREAVKYWSTSTGIDLDRLAFTTFREVVSDVGKDRAATATIDKVAQLAGKIDGGW